MLVGGVHFLIMALSFGPLMVVLGLLTIGNAGIGLCVTTSLNWRISWLNYGFLKVDTGGPGCCVAGYLAVSWAKAPLPPDRSPVFGAQRSGC